MKKILFLLILLSIFGCKKEETESNLAQPAIPTTEKTAKEIEYERIMKQKKIAFSEIGDCDEGVSGDTIHKRNFAYLDTFSISGSEVKANFKAISACCYYFGGDYQTSGDTLVFTYENVGEQECNCLCWHRFRLEIADPPAGVKHLKLVQK